MDSRSWHRLSELFLAAAALPHEDREAFVASACRGNPELKASLERLLGADAEAGSFMDEPVLGTLSDDSWVDDPDDDDLDDDGVDG